MSCSLQFFQLYFKKVRLNFCAAVWLSEIPVTQIVLSCCTFDFLAWLSTWALVFESREDFMLHGMPYNLHRVRVKGNSHHRFEYT